MLLSDAGGSPCYGDNGGGVYQMDDGKLTVYGAVIKGSSGCDENSRSQIVVSDFYDLHRLNEIENLYNQCNWPS